MSEPDRCKRCGSPLPTDVLGGHCPKCLLEAGLAVTAAALPKVTHPERVGPYYVLNLLGEGGMGIVYLAEQREPMRRRVALKLMKYGFNSRQVIGRFESERQALALMNHPGVARVFDAGLAEDGRPYFVMEYVAGLPITEFCDRRQLSVRDRLKLFVLVCDAIQHAHQKGLIHRDIKPSNVLVTEQEGAPSVKVIDFGVAKAINQPLSQGALFTEHGVMVGTPAYMSPEQTETDALDVDTRSDIYSLGVLLYELLVGALPFDAKSLKHAALAEMLRQIREEEPQKPTTRLERLGETAETVARHRQTDIRSLSRLLRGDLDWITMRALEKNPTRRYASASEFAADIQRYFAQEPVVAGPPSARYRIQKLVRRHRAGTAAVFAVFFSLALGVVVSSTFYVRAENERATAQLETTALEAAIHNEPEQYFRIAKEVLERRRAALGDRNLDFARQLVLHLAVALDVSVAPEERRAWEQQAIEITSRALDEGDPSAVDVFLLLADSAELSAKLQGLSVKALALIQRQGKNLSSEEAGRLANLLEYERAARPGDPEAERVARDVLRLRRQQALPSRSKRLQNSIEDLADLLFRKASVLAHRGELAAACPAYREARDLAGELNLDKAMYSQAKVLELDAHFSLCSSSSNDAPLKQVYLGLAKSEGKNNSATQSVLNRLIGFYEQHGMQQEASTYRGMRSSISLSDVWDLGPVDFRQGVLRVDDVVSLPLDRSRTWVVLHGGTPSWVTLDETALRAGRLIVRETAASISHAPLLPWTTEEAAFNAQRAAPGCTIDCSSRWALEPRASVADPVRERVLLFYLKSVHGPPAAAGGQRMESGTSLAVWHGVDGPAERPEVRSGDKKRELLFGFEEPAWGTAALVIDNLLYAYACEGEGPFKRDKIDCLVAKAPLDQVLDRRSWRFYAGGARWSEDWREAIPVLDPGTIERFSIHWNKYLGKLVAISTKGLTHRIELRVADRPEGPWSESVSEVEALRPSTGLPFPWIGVSMGHPELAEEDGRVEYLTYKRSSDTGNEIRMVRIEFAKK